MTGTSPHPVFVMTPCPRRSIGLALGLSILVQSAAAASPDETRVADPNVLVVVADDLGVDVLDVYGLASRLAPTPTIDSLAAQGLRFEYAYASPTCSPTRANIQTGRHGFRNTVTSGTQPAETSALPDDEVTIAELLEAGTNDLYATGAFGKWHLATELVGGATSPNDQGYDHYDGSPYNLYQNGSDDFSTWKRVTNGVVSLSTTYATTATVDAARDWIAATPEPWFAYVAFHAPHSPYHVPPAHLFTTDVTGGDPDTNPRPLYDAMIEALDAELGRLLASIPPDELSRTTIVFMGDNGTPAECTTAPFDPQHAKGTAYEGGVRVPLIVSGANVTARGQTTTALVHAVDLLPTVAELAGVDPAVHAPGVQLDGLSLVPLFTDPTASLPRDTVFSQLDTPNTPDGPFCHLDLGFGSPTTDASMTLCGPHLYPGGDGARLRVADTLSPGAPAVVIVSFGFAPALPLGGGIIAPGLPWAGVMWTTTDSAGAVTIPMPAEIPLLPSPFTLVLQTAFLEPSREWKLTNAVAASYEDTPFSRTMIRDAQYKLIRDVTGAPGSEVVVERLFDLAVDPFETDDLLEVGAPPLTPEQAAAHATLTAELDALLASA